MIAGMAEEGTPAASKVLGNDDLLSEILHRVDSPTTLVRVAAVSKRWLRVASDPAFLRRFGKRHPRRLLGFYVTGWSLPLSPMFIPMPPASERPDTAELIGAAIPVPRDFRWYKVSDSRNGRVLFFKSRELMFPRGRLAVRDLGGAMAELPPPPLSALFWDDLFHAFFLPDVEGDDATCYRVVVDDVDRTVSAEVTALRSGAWSVLCSTSAQLAAAPERIDNKATVLAGGKVYALAKAGYIICVDLGTASVFAIELPDGVAYDYYGRRKLVLCRGDGSVLCLLHLSRDEKLISVWLRRMDGDQQVTAGEWILRETIAVKEICDDLVKEGYLVHSLATVGDNAEFVLLNLSVVDGTVVVYLHLPTQRAEKVYHHVPWEREDYLDRVDVHPLFMIGPPFFPALDSDEARRRWSHVRHHPPPSSLPPLLPLPTKPAPLKSGAAFWPSARFQASILRDFHCLVSRPLPPIRPSHLVSIWVVHGRSQYCINPVFIQNAMAFWFSTPYDRCPVTQIQVGVFRVDVANSNVASVIFMRGAVRFGTTLLHFFLDE